MSAERGHPQIADGGGIRATQGISVMATLRASHGDIEEAATYLSIPARLARAAVEYYAEFTEEIDRDATLAAEIERDERARWERQQRALA